MPLKERLALGGAALAAGAACLLWQQPPAALALAELGGGLLAGLGLNALYDALLARLVSGWVASGTACTGRQLRDGRERRGDKRRDKLCTSPTCWTLPQHLRLARLLPCHRCPACASLQGLTMHAMVPVVDGANHLTTVRTDMAYDHWLDAFTLRAHRAFTRGEQVGGRWRRQGGRGASPVRRLWAFHVVASSKQDNGREGCAHPDAYI